MRSVPGNPSELSQSAELAYWQSHGLSDWKGFGARYLAVFPFDALDYTSQSILDIGSGPVSVFEALAPAGADVVACDALADAYNDLVPDKKFLICREMPSRAFDRITMLNMLDHMEDPDGFLRQVATRLSRDGEAWILCHINRPYGAAEHPQNFRFWHLTRMIQRHFDIRHAWLVNDGGAMLWPYAWCGRCVPQAANRFARSIVGLRTNASCLSTLAYYYARRFFRKAIRSIGMRRIRK